MNAPTTGYSLESVYTIRSTYRASSELPESPASAEHEISFGWDWRVTRHRHFEILMSATVRRAGVGDEMEAAIVGAFEVIGEVQTVELEAFVAQNGPALLMPYLRQALTNLSAAGPNGAFLLPPINVRALSSQFDMERASGTRQLRSGRSLFEPSPPAAAGEAKASKA